MAGFRLLALAVAIALTGCASVNADARSLNGTSWRVAAINGTSIPASDMFRMSFTATVLSARFGCNNGGGEYRVTGNIMHTGPIAATQMACASATDEPGPGPMEFERMGFAVVSQPMQMDWRGAHALTLSNAAGSISLERVP